jgi:hypothetical protein
MKRRNQNKSFTTDASAYDGFDVNSLLHPAQAFAHPSDVVNDYDLTLSEKRAILASWVSDACAVEASTTLRRTPGSTPVSFDDIMDALRTTQITRLHCRSKFAALVCGLKPRMF